MADMTQFFNLSTPAKRFRFIAVIEAMTWAALIIAMIVKYGFGNESAVAIPGAAHGAAFVVFGILALVTAVTLAWDWKVSLLALASSVPPFGTVLFERWARRNGHLAELSDDQAAGDPALVPAKVD